MLGSYSRLVDSPDAFGSDAVDRAGTGLELGPTDEVADRGVARTGELVQRESPASTTGALRQWQPRARQPAALGARRLGRSVSQAVVTVAFYTISSVLPFCI